MEIAIVSIILFISGAIIGFMIGNKKPEKMKIPLTLEKGSDGKVWGSVKCNETFFATYGDNQAELEYKMKQNLFDFVGIYPESVEFIIESMPVSRLN
jgi:hypothetical protein